MADSLSSRRSYGSDGLNKGVWPNPVPGQLITASDRFFTRSHAPVPVIDPDTWGLEVDGLVERPGRFSLTQLGRDFSEHRVVATLGCAGMRRAEFLDMGPLPGELPWGPDAASTGRWSGVGLRDVLEAVGVSSRAGHVEFIGLDQVLRLESTFGFGGSIDLKKALAGDVLLATHLNDEPLSPEHGFPVRVVVPGWIGARSVKWLGRIVVRPDPSENYFQTKAYRIERTINPEAPTDVSGGVPLAELPVNAVILDPKPGQSIQAGPVVVLGWAIGQGGSGLAAIEVSGDGGARWVGARPTAGGEAGVWTFWEARVTLAGGPRELVVRATDVGGRSQPATLQECWNVKGYCNNAWHRVRLTVK